MSDYNELITTGKNGIGLMARFFSGRGNGWSYNNHFAFVIAEINRRLSDPLQNQQEIEFAVIRAIETIYEKYSIAMIADSQNGLIANQRLNLSSMGRQLFAKLKNTNAKVAAAAALGFIKAVDSHSGLKNGLEFKSANAAIRSLILQDMLYSNSEVLVLETILNSLLVDLDSVFKGDILFYFDTMTSVQGVADFYERVVAMSANPNWQTRRSGVHERKVAALSILKHYGYK